MKTPLTGEANLPQPCPDCHETTLVLAWGLATRPVGSYSLAGAQLKISVRTWARVSCCACDYHIDGHLQDPVMSDDGLWFTDGQFIGDAA